MEEFELEPGETLTVSVRKHPVVFVLELLPFFIAAIAPLIVFPILASFTHMTPALASSNVGSIDLSLADPWVRFFLGIWWLLAWTGAFNTFTRYYLDVWVITSIRIVDIHQYGFFNRHVSSFLLAKVQDVSTEVDGFFPTMFHYGTLRVETAGDASQHFIMSGIPDPQGLRDLIMREIAVLQHEVPPGAQL